jgi:hypothetical protein
LYSDYFLLLASFENVLVLICIVDKFGHATFLRGDFFVW